jgi:hypothetical protein
MTFTAHSWRRHAFQMLALPWIIVLFHLLQHKNSQDNIIRSVAIFKPLNTQKTRLLEIWLQMRYLRFEVLTAANVKMAVCWTVAPCSFTEVYQCFRGSFTGSQTTRRYNPEDIHLQICYSWHAVRPSNAFFNNRWKKINETKTNNRILFIFQK